MLSLNLVMLSWPQGFAELGHVVAGIVDDEGAPLNLLMPSSSSVCDQIG